MKVDFLQKYGSNRVARGAPESLPTNAARVLTIPKRD
jgi:hypothetical protein